MRYMIVLVMVLGMGPFGFAIPVPVVDVDPAVQGTPTGSGMGGLYAWYFDVVEPLPVTHLAWFDEGRHGISPGHEISIWRRPLNGDYSIIASAMIPGGTQAELLGPWRRVEIPALVLEPGDYAVSGLGTDDQFSTDVVRVVGDIQGIRDPRIVEPLPGASEDRTKLPELVFAIHGYMFGPTFFVEPVPEPSTLILLLMAIPIFAYAIRVRTRYGQG